MEGSPLKALPVEYADLRRRVMNENGIHIIYPLGRDYGLSLDGSMDMFEGLTIRVIGYTYYPGSNYEIAIGGRDRVAYALMKWSGNYPYALLKPSSGRAYYETGSEAHYYGDAYSFAIRARYDNSKGESYQAAPRLEAAIVRCSSSTECCQEFPAADPDRSGWNPTLQVPDSASVFDLKIPPTRPSSGDTALALVV
ncbi:hypothetical protein MRX96_006339 [Rhipicephalus microplus]